ncbi:DNA-directed DNA polymerase [Tanacetum coccineum]
MIRPLLDEEGLPPFVCKMGKSSRNKKQAMETLNFFYQDIGTSSSTGGHLTQEEATKEALAIRISQKFGLLEVELNGKIVKEEEEAVKRIKGEALKEKDDPRAFIFLIRLEGQVNENSLADTRSDINIMPYQIYEQLGREDMKKVDRGITMINHTQEEATGILINVLCQVEVTTLIAKFLILDIPIDHDPPIVVGRGFLHTIGGIVNTPKRLFSTFDGFCHQTFRAARSDVMRNAKSNSDDEEDFQIKRNKFGAPIYGPKPTPYLNCTNPEDQSSAIQTTTRTHDDEAGSSRSKCPRKHETVEEVLLPQVHHEFLLWEGCNRDAKSRMGCDGEIDDMLRIRLREAGSDEDIFTSVAWIRAFNINKPIYAELCHEFYSTYEFDEVLGLYQAVELEEEGFNVYFEGGLRSDEHFIA